MLESGRAGSRSSSVVNSIIPPFHSFLSNPSFRRSCGWNEPHRGEANPPRPQTSQSSILVNLRIPALAHLLLGRGLPLGLAELHFYPFSCAQDLALKVETATLLGIVQVEQFLEALHDMLEVGFTALWGLDIEDATGFVEGQAAGREGVGGGGVALGGLGSVFGSGRGLSIGLGECTAEDTSAREDDLRDDAMGLRGLVIVLNFNVGKENSYHGGGELTTKGKEGGRRLGGLEGGGERGSAGGREKKEKFGGERRQYNLQ